MKLKRFIPLLLVIVLLQSCVGTDVQDFQYVSEQVVITDHPLSLQVGDTYEFQAEYRDSLGVRSVGLVNWTVSDPTILEIDEFGIGNGLQAGTVEVRATFNDIFDEVTVEVGDETVGGATERTGSLSGRSGYEISGDFRIFEENDTVYLEFINAEIDDAPGPYYYLSNARNNVNGGLNLGVAEDGNSLYALPDDVSVNSYNVVVVWCEPFSVTLGSGEFED